MSMILTPLWLEDIDGDTWIVCAPFKYFSSLLKGVVIVPIGTETDLASIPPFIRWFIPKSGKYNKAAVLHDAGYRGKLVTASGDRIHLIKPLADLLFLEAAELVGVNRYLRDIMYNSVRIFGSTNQ